MIRLKVRLLLLGLNPAGDPQPHATPSQPSSDRAKGSSNQLPRRRTPSIAESRDNLAARTRKTTPRLSKRLSSRRLLRKGRRSARCPRARRRAVERAAR